MDGVGVGSFKDKLAKLEDEKAFLQEKLDRLKVIMMNDELRVVTNEEVLTLIAKVKPYVLTRNIPQCKKFIKDYIQQVIVYDSHIEVIFNVAFSMGKYLKVRKKSKIFREKIYSKDYCVKYFKKYEYMIV